MMVLVCFKYCVEVARHVASCISSCSVVVHFISFKNEDAFIFIWITFCFYVYFFQDADRVKFIIFFERISAFCLLLSLFILCFSWIQIWFTRSGNEAFCSFYVIFYSFIYRYTYIYFFLIAGKHEEKGWIVWVSLLIYLYIFYIIYLLVAMGKRRKRALEPKIPLELVP